MRTKKVLTTLALIACVLMVGCNDTGTIPTGIPDIVLNVSASSMQGSPGVPVTVTGRIANAGTVPMLREDGCDVWAGGMYYAVLDTGGQQLFLNDPRYLKGCPVTETWFYPGQSFTGAILFNGILYDALGNTYHAPSGKYSILIGFTYPAPSPGESYLIHQSAIIQWNGQ